MKSIDIIIPNYNYACYLRHCVSSVLSQSSIRMRVLIIDNASSDGSQQVARDLAALDSRVELLLREKNLGPHKSFNDGIDWAQSDYFIILCSDDYLAPGALEYAVDLMEAHPEVHLTYGASRFLGTEEVLESRCSLECPRWTIKDGPTFLRDICRIGRNIISGPTAIVRTSVQKQVGHYNPKLIHTDDLEMWLRFALQGSIATTDAVQAVARVHPSNQSATVGDLCQWSMEFEAAYRSFFNGAGADLDNAEDLLRLARRALSDRAYWSAISLLCRGERGWRDLLVHAVRLRPAAALVPPVSYLVHRPDASSLIKASLSALTRRIAKTA
ncbi:glycosyltransferase family A protein [Inquilinus sp. OTU3971]|uniref:glycosyltransferase family A protein n=1 Tax=Inquilinus sp. OTU3971 TaxID=3043855 RepID=UPI00313BDFCA